MCSEGENDMNSPLPFSRRQMLRTSGLGIGSLALAWLMRDKTVAAPIASGGSIPDNLLPRQGHFEPQIKAVIMMVQNGGPSQIELFDEKPELRRRDGQRHTEPVEQSKKVVRPINCWAHRSSFRLAASAA